jgi:hypothetical protein
LCSEEIVDFGKVFTRAIGSEGGGGVEVLYFNDSSPLDANCRKVLHVLANEHLAEFTFDGIRRKTGMHQETLSRTLERLRKQSLLVRTSRGYSVSHESAVTEIESLNHDHSGQDPVPLAQIQLPSDIDIHNVIDAIQRKWFSNLRWLGYSIMGERVILKWLTEDNQIQIEATFSDGSVQIQARSRTLQLNRSIMAANHLLAFIVRIYEKQPRARM